jgi:hypothetical protein
MMEQLPQVFLADHALYLETGRVFVFIRYESFLFLNINKL